VSTTGAGLRLHYAMQIWVKKTLLIKGINSFKLFFSIGGEFPTVKIIGYRRLFTRRYKRRGVYISAVKSGRQIDAQDILPVETSGRYAVEVPKFFKKRYFSNKLKRMPSSIKYRKASFKHNLLPLVNKKFSATQFRRLFFFETFSNLFYPTAAGSVAADGADADVLENAALPAQLQFLEELKFSSKSSANNIIN
jgi:hypothetical protein